MSTQFVTDADLPLLRAAVESSPSGMLMIDASGDIVLINREVERIFGYKRDELLGKSVEMLIPAASRAKHIGLRDSFHAASEVRPMGRNRELMGLRKDGTEVPVEIGLMSVATGGGSFVVSTIVDITARKAGEAELRRLENELRQAQKMEAIGRLAGGIAHDFNNILGAIVGLAELARESSDENERDKDLSDLLIATARGRTLVERMLTFSRRQEIQRKPLDFAAIVLGSLRLLRAVLPAPVDIRFNPVGEIPRIAADATCVQQVLLNLATNAAHAMVGGGVIELNLERFEATADIAHKWPGFRNGSYVALRVHDRGPGMDRETIAKAFEPFFTTKPAGQGSGLGLTIVHRIMRDHDGAVWIESNPGHGTTVTCLFPAAGEAAVGESRIDPVRLSAGKGQRLLYVDDEVTLTVIVKRRLEAAGYSVDIATDPIVALDRFRATPADFHLVITDLSMPRMNGLDLAREVTKIRAGMPIVLITGYAEDLSERDIRESGIRRIVRKPVTHHELTAAVQLSLAGES